MSQAGSVLLWAVVTAIAGVVLTVLGWILWLIDRRFDDEPDLRAGAKLMRVGLTVTLGAGAVAAGIVVAG